MYALSAKTMVEVHLMSQGGKPNQMDYDYDDEANAVICDGDAYSVQEWIAVESQLLIFLDQQPDITMEVLSEMHKAEEFHNDELGFYDIFYTRMHNALSRAAGSLRFFG